MDNYMIKIGTRTQDAECEDDIALATALQNFMSSEGYRIDFTFPDGSSLYIYRSDDPMENSKFDHPAFSRYNQYQSQVLIYNPNSLEEQTTLPENVYNINDYKKNKSE